MIPSLTVRQARLVLVGSCLFAVGVGVTALLMLAGQRPFTVLVAFAGAGLAVLGGGLRFVPARAGRTLLGTVLGWEAFRQGMTVEGVAVSDGGWQPHGSPSSWDERPDDDSGTGPMRLRNRVNHYCGRAVSWGLLPLGVLLGDSSDGAAVEAALSVVALCVLSAVTSVFLTRPYVEVQRAVAVVRNPLNRYEFRVGDGRLVGDGAQRGRYPRLRVGRREIVLVAMEESVAMTLRGTHAPLDRFRAAMAADQAVGRGDADASARAARALLDVELGVLLASWLLLALALLARAANAV